MPPAVVPGRRGDLGMCGTVRSPHSLGTKAGAQHVAGGAAALGTCSPGLVSSSGFHRSLSGGRAPPTCAPGSRALRPSPQGPVGRSEPVAHLGPAWQTRLTDLVFGRNLYCEESVCETPCVRHTGDLRSALCALGLKVASRGPRVRAKAPLPPLPEWGDTGAAGSSRSFLSWCSRALGLGPL